MGNTPTIHNAALLGQIAPAVVMPGDPLRAAYLAENYLRDPTLHSNLRGIPVYTGTYRGAPVSVMASGMGAGSMGIYSHELFWDYRVERIVRAGTAGGLSPALSLRDVVLGVSCSTDSGFAAQFELPGVFAPCCSFSLASAADRIGREKGLSIRGGMLFSGAAFHYTDSYLRRWAEAGALAALLNGEAAEPGERTQQMLQEQVAANRRRLNQIMTVDRVLNQRLGREQSAYQ